MYCITSGLVERFILLDMKCEKIVAWTCLDLKSFISTSFTALDAEFAFVQHFHCVLT